MIINYPNNQQFDTQCHHNNRKAKRILHTFKMDSQLLGLEIGATVFVFAIGGKIDFILVWFLFLVTYGTKRKNGKSLD